MSEASHHDGSPAALRAATLLPQYEQALAAAQAAHDAYSAALLSGDLRALTVAAERDAQAAGFLAGITRHVLRQK